MISSELAKIAPRDFSQIIRTQRDRLVSTCTADHIVKLEDEFKAFKSHLLLSSSARDAISVGVLEARQQGSVFEKRWDCFRGLF